MIRVHSPNDKMIDSLTVRILPQLMMPCRPDTEKHLRSASPSAQPSTIQVCLHVRFWQLDMLAQAAKDQCAQQCWYIMLSIETWETCTENGIVIMCAY